MGNRIVARHHDQRRDAYLIERHASQSRDGIAYVEYGPGCPWSDRDQRLRELSYEFALGRSSRVLRTHTQESQHRAATVAHHPHGEIPPEQAGKEPPRAEYGVKNRVSSTGLRAGRQHGAAECKAHGTVPVSEDKLEGGNGPSREAHDRHLLDAQLVE